MGRPRVHGERVQIGLRVDREMLGRIGDELTATGKKSTNALVVAALEEYLTRAEARRRPRTPINRDWKG